MQDMLTVTCPSYGKPQSLTMSVLPVHRLLPHRLPQHLQLSPLPVLKALLSGRFSFSFRISLDIISSWNLLRHSQPPVLTRQPGLITTWRLLFIVGRYHLSSRIKPGRRALLSSSGFFYIQFLTVFVTS